jgi:uncharacterized protein YqeY
MSALKDRLTADLSSSMKARDALTTGTLRMVLTAVRVEEVAGKSPRELSEEEVLALLIRETKKRREAAEAFDGAGRTALAEQERAEEQVLARYLPVQLGESELIELVTRIISEVGATELKQLGMVMRAAQAAAGGRAEGGRIAAEVRRQLAG